MNLSSQDGADSKKKKKLIYLNVTNFLTLKWVLYVSKISWPVSHIHLDTNTQQQNWEIDKSDNLCSGVTFPWKCFLRLVQKIQVYFLDTT